MTSEKIEMVATVVVGGYSRGTSLESKIITFDIKSHEYIKRVFSNREGDYMDLVLDPNKGIYVEKYDYDSDNKHQYIFVPWKN